MHKSDRYRTGNLLKFRYPERMDVVASNGSTLHARMAGPTQDTIQGQSDFLKDDGSLLDYDTPEREVAPGVRLARSATGGLALRVGDLRKVLAEAETDALIKLKAAKVTAPTDDGI